MNIPDEWLYEYSIIRYVPRPDRGESLNIGLLMMNKRRKWIKGKIYIDDDRTKNFYPLVDLHGLKVQCKLFEKNDVPSKNLPVEEKYRWLSAEKSAVIRVSPSHPGIVRREIFDIATNIENIKDDERIETHSAEKIMESEFNRLFKELILPIK